jgi:hypothetical protein
MLVWAIGSGFGMIDGVVNSDRPLREAFPVLYECSLHRDATISPFRWARVMGL